MSRVGQRYAAAATAERIRLSGEMISSVLSILLPNWREGTVPCLRVPQGNFVAAQNIRSNGHGGATLAVAALPATRAALNHE